MRFGTVIAVKDVNAAREFYEEILGLTVRDNFGFCVSFACGLSLQEKFGWLTGILNCEMKEQENNWELYFEEADFDNLVKKIKSWPGVRLLHDVIEQSWGQRIIRFYDPDNHLIGVGENMKFVVTRFMDQGMAIEDIAGKMDVNKENVLRMLKD